MAEVTFRDFAGAIMGGDLPRAGQVLEELLDLDDEPAAAAAKYFHRQMTSDPAFMGKAMGLRSAVTGGSDETIAALLKDCFGLEGDAVPPAITELRRRYPA